MKIQEKVAHSSVQSILESSRFDRIDVFQMHTTNFIPTECEVLGCLVHHERTVFFLPEVHVRKGVIQWVAPSSRKPPGGRHPVLDYGTSVIMPGLVDV